VKIPDDLALCIYRITQEALNNAVKYADAKTIEIMLKRENNMLILTVRDNGSGFDPRGIHEKPGLGLSSMRERAELAGGSFEMRSQPGKGTSLSAIVPLEGTAR